MVFFFQRLPTELDARFASSCVGQANKQRAVALSNNKQRITRSLFAAYTLNLVRINRRALDVRSRARTRRNPRVLACLRVRDACCQSCKAAGVNDLLSQDLEFVLG